MKQPLKLSYSEVLALSSTSQIATLDCTVGWYSVQRWRGIALKHLLDLAEIDQGSWLVQFRAQEGYQHTLTLAEAKVTSSWRHMWVVKRSAMCMASH